MKTLLTERKEIAKALNFGKYPVLSLDLDSHGKGYSTGCKVRVDYCNEYVKCEVFVENGRWGLSGGGCCLKTDIGYSDWMEALGYAQAPIVKPGDIVAIAMHSKELGVFMVKLMRVGKRIDPNCVTVVELEEMKEEN